MTAFPQLLRITLFTLLAILPVALAQQSASLSGVITDPSGAMILGATVTLHATQSGGPPDFIAKTGTGGRYTLFAPVGSTYLLVVTAPMFATYESKPFRLSAGKPATLDIRLGTVVDAQQITVDDSNSLDTDPTHNGDSITLRGKALNDLPLDSTELLQELQGLSGSPTPDLYVDGFSNGTLPPRDTIREIRINQNPYSAEYDTNPGNGRVEIFTKPGNGQLHGDFYAYGNSNSFNTSDPFVTNQPPYYSDNFYGALSGPLTRHSSFFSNGGFSNQETNGLINAQTLDPNNPNNEIYVTDAVPAPDNSYNFSTRLDLSAFEKSTLIFRYSINHSAETKGGVGSFALPEQGYNNRDTNQIFQLSNSQILTPKIVNDTRFQYTRSRVAQVPDSNLPQISVEGAFTGGGNAGGSYNDNQDRYELQNYISQTAGKQYFTYGGRFRATRDANRSSANYNGTYTFANLTAASSICSSATSCTACNSLLSSCNSYQTTIQQLTQPYPPSLAAIQALGGGPSQFSITQGDPSVAVMVADGAFFFQDDWKIKPTVTLSGGLRLETQNVIADKVDYAPRLGFAWQLKTRKGKPPLYVLRGGAGIFYNRFGSGNVLQAERQNGITQQEYIVSNPQFFCPLGPCANQAGNLAGNQAESSIYQISPRLHAPYFISTTLSLERQVRNWGTVTATYLEYRGVRQLLTDNINAPLPGTYNPAIPTSGVRPFGGNENIYQYQTTGLYRTNRLTTNFYLNHIDHDHIFIVGFYQLQHITADTSGGFPSNQYDIGADQGRANNDIRHSAFIGAGTDLPFSFHAFTFTRAQSGTPFNITLGQDVNGDSIFTDRPTFATDLTRPSVVVTRFGAFDTSPIAGQTTIPNNYGHGPGLFIVNFQLQRDFSFGPALKPPPNAAASKLAPGQKPHIDRKFSLNMTIDIQNLFNQVNLAPPVGTLNSPLFGRSISLASGANSSANRVIALETYLHF